MHLLEWDLKIVAMLLTSMSHYRTTSSKQKHRYRTRSLIYGSSLCPDNNHINLQACVCWMATHKFTPDRSAWSILPLSIYTTAADYVYIHWMGTNSSLSPPFSHPLTLSFSLSPSLPFRQVKQSEELAKEEAKPFEHKDYSLKQGQKIHISLGVSRSCRVTILNYWFYACMISSLDSDNNYMT